MKEQLEIEELSQVIEQEREDQIKQLKAQLAEAEEKANNNSNAADILTDLLSKGKVKQLGDGSIDVISGPNIIQNQHEANE